MNIKIANRRLIRFSGIVAILILSLSTVSCVKDTKSNNESQLNKPDEKSAPSEKYSEKSANDYTSDENQVYDVIEEMPQFPGGESELLKYLGKNIIYPRSALKQGIHGRVIVRFVINKSGETEKVEVVRSLNPACDREAIRVVKSLPKWIPGKLNGENVSVWFTLPINFKIQ